MSPISTPSRESRDESLRRLTSSGLLLDDETRMKTKDGRLLDVLRSIVVRRNPDGSILGYQTVYRDVTELKRAEQAMRESEQKYRQLFDQSVAPISLFTADGLVLEANDAWFRLFGYARDEMTRVTAR